MKCDLFDGRRLVASVLGAMACAVCLFSEARGQVHVPAHGPAPPPMKYIPDGDRTKLSEERDLKDRTRLSLQMADERLERAKALTESKQYDAAATELGIYQALIEDALRFLRASDRPASKNRDVYKRLEMGLRPHGARLETIRRMTPADDAINVRAAYEFIRGARTEALNAFYGDTVVREPQGNKSSTQERAKTAPSKPQDEKQ